jgi:hypothetical protein
MLKPASKTLIEPERGGTFRVVERRVTPVGLAWGTAASAVCVIADKLPTKPQARQLFDDLRTGARP